VKHEKWPYDLGLQEGYYISAVFSKSSQATQAFRTPFLDASKLTPEVQAVVTSTRDQGLKLPSSGRSSSCRLSWLGKPLWKLLGGRDKGRGSAKERMKMMYPASPWSLYSTSLVFISSRTVQFLEISNSEPVERMGKMKLNLPCWRLVKDSKEALTWASMANTHADNAKNAVNVVYAKNPTIKR
jgi:hypothetical protein